MSLSIFSHPDCVCPHCDKNLSSPSNLDRHMTSKKCRAVQKRKASGLPSRRKKLIKCIEPLATVTELLDSENLSPSFFDPDFSLTCGDCLKVCDSQEDFTSHIDTCLFRIKSRLNYYTTNCKNLQTRLRETDQIQENLQKELKIITIQRDTLTETVNLQSRIIDELKTRACSSSNDPFLIYPTFLSDELYLTDREVSSNSMCTNISEVSIIDREK